MFTDLFGQPRQKVALHLHTEMSDGRRSPEDVAKLYLEAGFDAIAFTDHWFWNWNGTYETMTILSGAEYNIGGRDAMDGVYHIVAIGCTTQPRVFHSDKPKKVAEAIRRAGGIAVLAHPAWSLNDPETVAGLKCFDATEIYNTVSGKGNNCRPDSSAFVDLLACRGLRLPLLAVDDAHWYTGDHLRSWVCVEAVDNEPKTLMTALRAGKFYATQGPEIHLRRKGDTLIVDCSPAEEILFYSNLVYAHGRALREHGMTHAEYQLISDKEKEKHKIVAGDRFVRAEVVDADGNRAWSNFLEIEDV